MLAISPIWLCLFCENSSILNEIPILRQAPDMFSKPMMEELNKSNSLIIIHDVLEVAGVIAATLKLMEYPDVYILKQ